MRKSSPLQVLLFALIATGASAYVELGKETIEPLRFPKFTLGGEFAMLRKLVAFNGSDLKRDLTNTYGGNLYAEAGLIRFFNAGVSVSFTKSAPFLKGSNILRMGLFAKPYLPLGSRVSLFSRIGLGPSVSIINEGFDYLEATFQEGKKPPPGFDKFKNTYGERIYGPFSVGFFGSADIGIEVFITSRFALLAEWGIRGDMLWAKLLNELKDVGRKPTSGKPSPTWFHYFIYDMPIMVSMHIIL